MRRLFYDFGELQKALKQVKTSSECMEIVTDLEARRCLSGWIGAAQQRAHELAREEVAARRASK